MGDSGIPKLSVPALHELRRIHSKHLAEVFPSPETHELYDRGCIMGRFATSPGTARPGSFFVERVTDLGLAALHRSER
jgi:hypothetical protein